MVRFQFGNLSAIQKAYLKRTYGQVIAAAIRTDYDPLTLRGRGFVYVSPEFGELKPDIEGLKGSRWTQDNGRLLEKVLVHELGHIYGVRHLAGTVMDHEYVTKVVTEKNAETNAEVLEESSFYNFIGEDYYKVCPEDYPEIKPKQWQLMRIENLDRCVGITMTTHEHFGWRFSVWELDEAGKGIRQLAYSSMNYAEHCDPLYSRNTTLTAQLPSEQSVVSTDRSILYGPPYIRGISCYADTALRNEIRDFMNNNGGPNGFPGMDFGQTNTVYRINLRHLRVVANKIYFEVEGISSEFKCVVPHTCPVQESASVHSCRRDPDGNDKTQMICTRPSTPGFELTLLRRPES